MPRRPMQDIVPGRSIRNVPLPERSRRPESAERKAPPVPERRHVVREEPEKVDRETLEEVRREFETNPSHSRRKGGGVGKFFLVALIIASVVALALLASNIFHGATITLTPKSASAALLDDLTAKKSGTAPDLSFQTVSVEEVGSRQVKANGEKRVTTQASGTIVIYNNHSAASQRLVKNTRFETPEGLIYRIAESVTVPGKKGSVPGSVEAVVYADETGEKYNVGLKDFTIPGFKGDPRFETFYARSKTPLEGGFSGMVKIVSDADLAKAQADIKAQATTNLLAKVKAEKGEDKVLFDRAHSVSCSPLPQENVSETEVLIKMKCELSVALFDKKALSSHLARANVSGYEGEPISISNIDSLVFAPKVGFDPKAESIAFTLSGSASFEWLYDESMLKESFLGARRDEASSIMKRFPMVDKADISIRPAWRQVFPDAAKDIIVKKGQ